MPGRRATRAGAVIAGVALVALTGYLVVMGLDKADKLASVLGMFAGLGGLAISAVGLVGERRKRADAQSVRGSSAAGSVTQIRDVKGNVRISREGRTDMGVMPVTPSAPQAVPEAKGQSVHETYVAGDIDQVDGADGDVTIEESP